MEKEKLRRLTGSMQQLAYVRPLKYEEGRASSLRAIEVRNGPLRFTVLADKCLDIEEFSYKGTSFNFLSKPGLQGRNAYDTHGQEALRSIMGGLVFTAGLQNICAPCTLDGTDYPMHGRIRTTPAEHLCCDAAWEGEDYVLRVSGEMREAELFGANLVLRRTIETHLGSKEITIIDTIENEGFRPEPLMILYHINLGYPLLAPGTRIAAASTSVRGREDFAQEHISQWAVMGEPKDGEGEYVFLHNLAKTPEDTSVVSVLNKELALGFQLEYSREHLPFFMEWMSCASGDYALGLEPSNSSVYGRPYHEKEKSLHYLEPQASETNVLRFRVLEGAGALRATSEQARASAAQNA